MGSFADRPLLTRKLCKSQFDEESSAPHFLPNSFSTSSIDSLTQVGRP
jgi:hypothetical protein